MEPRTLYALALALLTILCVAGAIFYATRDYRHVRRSQRHFDKRRQARLTQQANEG
jgi:hypothetical protein